MLEGDLEKNADAELKQLTEAKAKLDANKADKDYIKKTVQFGEEKTIADFKKGYILIMSHKEWTVPGAAVTTPAAAAAPDVTGANVPGTVVQQPKSGAFGLGMGFLGGRRKTKKSNKKSRKQKKYKKQPKSRKLFKGFMY